MSTVPPLNDSYLKRIHAKQMTIENVREYNSAMAFASVGVETQPPLEIVRTRPTGLTAISKAGK